MSALQYMWTYKFVRVGAGFLIVGAVAVLLFVVVSGLIVRSRLKRQGGRALTIEQLNTMSAEKGGKHQ